MPSFHLQANEEICFHIDSQQRWFLAVEHPGAPGQAHSMEGGKAFVYHLRAIRGTAGDYALKILKPKHRDPAMVEVCKKLDALKSRRGLEVCERLCLSPNRATQTLQQYPTLEYSILMRWMPGLSWFDAVQLTRTGRFSLDIGASRQLAWQLATLLASLEVGGMAHCDISGANVLFDLQTLDPQLIDVEDLFSPGAQPPRAIPAGTPGYQHLTSAQGQWKATGDRFAAAILLSEMLGWHDANVQSQCHGESFFDPAEMQNPASPRLPILSAALRQHDPALSALLARAWNSRNLEDCPTLQEWAQACGPIHFEPLRVPQKQTPPQPVTWSPISQPSAPTPIQAFWETLPTSPSGTTQIPPVRWSGGVDPTSGGNKSNA